MVMLPLPPGCRQATLVRREKRFRVLVRFPEGECWVHTNNSGSMLGLVREGRPCLVSPAPGAGRKMPWTLEMIRLDSGWVGVNTGTPNRLLEAAFRSGDLARVADVAGYLALRREATHGESRMDALLAGPGLPPLWVECKNVTLVEDEVALFPDAVTERGRKHLEELMDIRAEGHRAALFCCIQHPEGRCFGPADVVDPAFAAAFWRAVDAGVEVWAVRARVDEGGVDLGEAVPLVSPAGDA